MNRQRSRLENMFPIEVHRADDGREQTVEVVREQEHESQEDTPRQMLGMSFGMSEHFLLFWFCY